MKRTILIAVAVLALQVIIAINLIIFVIETERLTFYLSNMIV